MSNGLKYRWSDRRKAPPIDRHSIAKHQMLSAYLRLYVQTLAKDVKRERLRLTLIDGFAGGGIYTGMDGDEWKGSPLRMLDAAAEAEKEEQSRRHKNFSLDTRFWFVEDDHDTFHFLKATLQSHGYDTSGESKISLRHSRFQDSIEEIICDIEGRGTARRAIFVLDQYGYRDVPTSAIRAILGRLPNAEIILTFATDWLVDYLNDAPEFDEILKVIGLSSTARALLDSQHEDPANWRKAIQFSLYSDLAKRCGAEFYTPFFIHSENAHRTYWLMHLSNHIRAKDVMTSLHWELKNHFAHYGRSGLCMLGFDPRLIQAPRSFFFDDRARVETREALCEDLPRRLRANRSAMPFRAFFASITNETPATSLLVKEVLLELERNGEVGICHPDGSPSSPRTLIQDDALIVVPAQKLLTFAPA